MESDYEAQPIPAPMGAAHSTEGALRYQIDSHEVINEIEHGLKAERLAFVDGQPTWLTPKGVIPLINEKGINNVITILRSRLTKIFILSDLDQNSIEQITINIGETVIDDLYYNWETYGIKDTAAASTIVSLVTDTVYATMRKGYMGNYLKFLRTTQSIQEVQHHSHRPQAQQAVQSDGGFLNKIMGKRR